MDDLEPVLITCSLVSCLGDEVNSSQPRVWLSSQDMYRLNVAAGETVYACLSTKDGRPMNLLAEYLEGSPSKFGVGSYAVAVMAWPHSRLKPKTAAASASLQNMLGRPLDGDSILLYRCEKPESLSSELIRLRLLVERNTGLPLWLTRAPDRIQSPPSTATPKNPGVSPGRRNQTPVLSPSMRSSSPPIQLERNSRKKEQQKDAVVMKKESDPVRGRACLALLEKRGKRLSDSIQNLCLRHLEGQLLLPGNVVSVPLFGELMLFIVEGTEEGMMEVRAKSEVKVLLPFEEKVCKSKKNGYVDKAVSAAMAIDDDHEDGPAAQAARRAAESGAASLGISFSDIGGSSEQIRALRELVILPLQSPELFQEYGIARPKGVLTHGPPGTGKTVLARAAAKESGAALFVLNGPEIVSEYYGESEIRLRGVFAAAAACSPSIVFIDEIDAIAPARGSTNGEAGTRIVTTLLKEMDNVVGMPHMTSCVPLPASHSLPVDTPVVVIAATNRIDSIDLALRRPGRFDREIEVGVPTPQERLHILDRKLRKMRHRLSSDDISAIALGAHGYVGADLTALCNEAALEALKRHIASRGRHEDLWVQPEDFRKAETYVRPSAMREIAVEVPKVSWEDVGGLAYVKKRLREAVEWPLNNAGALKRIGADIPRGILLFGPPGCSKTLLARAVASQTGMNFLAVKGPELYSKYVGESEKAVASLFRRARANAPAIVFFDEIDGLVVARNGNSAGGVSQRVLSQVLQEMDGLEGLRGVVVLAATNRPDHLDSALLRPGRFDLLLYVPPPTEEERSEIFEVHTRNMPLCSDVDMRELAVMTPGYTGADISAICREAALTALEEDLASIAVALRHFRVGIGRIKPSADTTAQNLYESYIRNAL